MPKSGRHPRRKGAYNHLLPKECRILTLFGKKRNRRRPAPPWTLHPYQVHILAQLEVWEDRLRAQLKWSERLFFPALRLSTRQKG